MSNILVPLRDTRPPQIHKRDDHPVRIPHILDADGQPLQTNKFFANFFLGDQSQGVWTHPYCLCWSKGRSNPSSWGLAVSHIERELLALGPGSPSQYYINPIGIRYLILSAEELTQSTRLVVDGITAFGANVHLSPQEGERVIVSFPIFQGLGFVTGIYNGCKPLLQSAVLFRAFSLSQTRDGISKYKITLEDNSEWFMYVSVSAGTAIPVFQMQNNFTIIGPPQFSGIIQVAKKSGSSDCESILDKAAGTYPVSGSVKAEVREREGQYKLCWQKAGNTERPLMMFALPHHVQSFSAGTRKAITSVRLRTTTKGIATAVLADEWEMSERLLVDMGFSPWSAETGSITTLPYGVAKKVQAVAAAELDQDMNSQTNLDSMYFSGKGLSKFATIVYTVAELADDSTLAQIGLTKLKNAFAVFVENQQKYPLVYDTRWKGITSSATYVTGNATQDFGNTYYNDHHFHYGYFVHAAAVIAFLEKSWLLQGTNKIWVNSLIKDFANPDQSDEEYPFSRSFDWYHGHSWAKGLFESADGKDQESSSEDAFTSFALKMWGYASNDVNQEARGNLMLAIQARTLPQYYLMDNENSVHPPNFIGNKVVGILFENKADHTTYFGNNIEFIQGIHMIPINPSTALTRRREFIREEWEAFFSNGRVDTVQDGWRGLLYANYGIVNPSTAWAFFSQDNFNYGWLDAGASRTWYLAFIAALGNIQH